MKSTNIRLLLIMRRSLFLRNNNMFQIRSFSTIMKNQDDQIISKPYFENREKEISLRLENLLDSVDDIKVLIDGLKHFTHPKAFTMYKENQSKQNSDSVSQMTPTKIRNHIIYNAMVGLKDQSIVEKVLDSSLKILSSDNCLLSLNDKIHCLFHLCAMTRDKLAGVKKVQPLVKSIVIKNIDKSCEWTNDCVINAYMLLVESKMLKKNQKEFLLLFKEICDNSRIYSVDQLRKLVVYIKLRKRYIGNNDMHTNIELLYKNNISSILAKTDIPTFYHFITFFDKVKLSITKEEHKKLTKMICKRISRILEMKENELNKHNPYEITPYFSLLKMLECLPYLKHFEEEYLYRVNSDIQKIIEMKGIPNFSFLCKVLHFINKFEKYEKYSERLFDYCMQTILLEMKKNNFIDNMTLSRMKELIIVIERKQLISKSFSTEEEKDKFKILLRTSLVKCMKTKTSNDILFAFLLHTSKLLSKEEIKFLIEDNDFMNSYLNSIEMLSTKWKPVQFCILGCNLIQIIDPVELSEDISSESDNSSESESESSSDESQEEANKIVKDCILPIDITNDYKSRIIKSMTNNFYSKIDVVDTFELNYLNYNLNYWAKFAQLNIWSFEKLFVDKLQKSIDANIFIYPKFFDTDLKLIEAIHKAKQNGFGKSIDYKSYFDRVNNISKDVSFESIQKVKKLCDQK